VEMESEKEEYKKTIFQETEGRLDLGTNGSIFEF
jgi:hypothetical protein